VVELAIELEDILLLRPSTMVSPAGTELRTWSGRASAGTHAITIAMTNSKLQEMCVMASAARAVVGPRAADANKQHAVEKAVRIAAGLHGAVIDWNAAVAAPTDTVYEGVTRTLSRGCGDERAPGGGVSVEHDADKLAKRLTTPRQP